MKRIFLSKYSAGSSITVECLRLKICTHNRLVCDLFDKIIYVDLKSILLEKPIGKVFHILKDILLSNIKFN